MNKKKKIIVTGAAGFIGSHLGEGLSNHSEYPIIAVDDLTDGRKFKNLAYSDWDDYLDIDEFAKLITQPSHLFWDDVQTVFHQGACSDTTCWDGKHMLALNYDYSKRLLACCVAQQIPFYYASSAAIYGLCTECCVEKQYESPENVYGYSKLLFDNYVRKQLSHISSPVIGLRYFNVYGRNEARKVHMRSVVQHFYTALKETGKINVYDLGDGKPGAQARDFIYVQDVVDINLWLLNNLSIKNGIYNCGSGLAISFNDLAKTLIDYLGYGDIIYEPLPEKLRGAYQAYTRADMQALKDAGYTKPFSDLRNALADFIPLL